jgi:hypothetical protein
VLAGRAGLAHLGPWGDQAIIQVDTARAASLHQLLGPYSRFGWSHPGPAWFYLLALPYRALGSTPAALAVASVLVTAAFAALAVVLAHRVGGRWAGRLVATALAAEFALAGPAVWALVWNPVAIVVPASAFLIAGAGLTVGRWWMLPWLVAIGSFLVQTDVSTGLFVAVVGVGTLAAALASARRRRADASPPRPSATRLPLPLGLSVLVAGAAWAPPLAQQLTTPRGNLSQLISFFGHQGSRHGLGAASAAVAAALWPPLRGHLVSGDIHPPSPGAGLVVSMAIVAGAAVAAAGWRRRQPLATALGVASAATVIVGLVSATRATGSLFGYLTAWLVAGEVALFAGAGLLVVGIGRAARPALMLAWAAAAGGAVAVLAASALPSSPGGDEVRQLWDQARPALAPPGAMVEVDLAAGDRWPWAVGLVVELQHNGRRATIGRPWTFFFGGALAPIGRPAQLVSLWRPGEEPRPPGRLVARSGETWLFASSAGR